MTFFSFPNLPYLCYIPSCTLLFQAEGQLLLANVVHHLQQGRGSYDFGKLFRHQTITISQSDFDLAAEGLCDIDTLVDIVLALLSLLRHPPKTCANLKETNLEKFGGM